MTPQLTIGKLTDFDRLPELPLTCVPLFDGKNVVAIVYAGWRVPKADAQRHAQQGLARLGVGACSLA